MGTDLLAWMVVGAACSLAGLIYPFWRGASGVALNVLAGIGGALALGLFGRLLLEGSPRFRDLWSMPFAAAGALGAVIVFQVFHAATQLDPDERG